MRQENTHIKQGVCLVMPTVIGALLLVSACVLLVRAGVIGGIFTSASVSTCGGAASIKTPVTDGVVAEAVDETLA